MEDVQQKLGPMLVVGAGAMGAAILIGGIREAVISPLLATIAEPQDDRRSAMADIGMTAFPDVGGAAVQALSIEAEAEHGLTIVLAVKPQQLARVGADLDVAFGGTSRLIISVLAGAPAGKVRDACWPEARVVRAMPNTPARIGEGMSAIAPGPGATDDDMHTARTLFAACGRVVEVEEALIDAFTAAAGSGPAYLFYLAEAMERAARELGLGDDSRQIVNQTLLGAAHLLVETGQDPGALREAVTSPNGTTQAALDVFDAADLRAVVADAMRAARDRAEQMARE